MANTIDIKKYQNVIAYLCQKLGGEIRGKKKLAKLLYFADFDFYEKTEKSITGDVYRALPMGPFPVMLDEVTSKMQRNKIITIEHTEDLPGYNPTEVYHCTIKIEPVALSEQERKMLDRIVTRYGHLNGKQLEELSHSEAPYIGTELKNEIPYELAFYRGTDFSDLND